MKTQKDRLMQRLESERNALATLTPLALSITEMLGEDTRVTVAGIAAATGASRNTIRPLS